MIKITSRGDFQKTRDFLNRMIKGQLFSDLDRWGQMGVNALEISTPKKTGLTSRSWRYRIMHNSYGPSIEWYNTNDADGTPVVILIEYSHGTGTGGFVQGRDFINPAMRPIFDRIAADITKEVNS